MHVVECGTKGDCMSWGSMEMLWIWIGLDIQNIRKMFHEGASLSFSSKLAGHVYCLINVSSTANLMKRLSSDKFTPIKRFRASYCNPPKSGKNSTYEIIIFSSSGPALVIIIFSGLETHPRPRFTAEVSRPGRHWAKMGQNGSKQVSTTLGFF